MSEKSARVCTHKQTNKQTKGNKMYNIGDTITYTTFGGGYRTGVVIGKYDDIKNGLSGFDMQLQDGTTVWGYDSQIIKVFFGQRA